MSDIVERATTAVKSFTAPDVSEGSPRFHLTDDDIRALVRVVIRTMHEPTDDMLDYAWPMLTTATNGFYKEPGRAFWKAMVAAAIAPEAVTADGKQGR